MVSKFLRYSWELKVLISCRNLQCRNWFQKWVLTIDYDSISNIVLEKYDELFLLICHDSEISLEKWNDSSLRTKPIQMNQEKYLPYSRTFRKIQLFKIREKVLLSFGTQYNWVFVFDLFIFQNIILILFTPVYLCNLFNEMITSYLGSNGSIIPGWKEM